jgi:hypothetical protein
MGSTSNGGVETGWDAKADGNATIHNKNVSIAVTSEAASRASGMFRRRITAHVPIRGRRTIRVRTHG